MLRSVASKVMWVGRATIFVVGLAVVLFLTLAIVAQAADARVPSLKKGVVNTVKSMTTLVGSIADPILKLDNNGSGPALQLEVGSGTPPLTVNQDTGAPKAGTATGLSADELDGLDSGALRSLGAVSAGSNPPANPSQGLIAAAQITTPANGDLFIIGDVTDAGVLTCPNTCTLTLGLYVDGQPVPGSARTVTGGSGTLRDRTFFALAPGVAAGEHTVQIGVDFGGNGGGYSGGNTAHTGVVFLGD